jgi:hypothetical protein
MIYCASAYNLKAYTAFYLIIVMPDVEEGSHIYSPCKFNNYIEMRIGFKGKRVNELSFARSPLISCLIFL